MKTITLLLLLSSCLAFSQGPQVAVWRVTPKNVCPGDSVKIDFKFNQPAGGNTVTTVYFNMYQPIHIVWQGSYMQFYSMPKETFPPLGNLDSCYYMWVHIPDNYPAGVHTINANLPGQNNTFTITLPNISIPSNTVCAGMSYTFNPSGATTYTYSSGSVITPAITSTYVISGTLNGCVNSKTVTINVIDCTTGIEEYTSTESLLKTYSLYGNVIYYDPKTRKKFIIVR